MKTEIFYKNDSKTILKLWKCLFICYPKAVLRIFKSCLSLATFHVTVKQHRISNGRKCNWVFFIVSTMVVLSLRKTRKIRFRHWQILLWNFHKNTYTRFQLSRRANIFSPISLDPHRVCPKSTLYLRRFGNSFLIQGIVFLLKSSSHSALVAFTSFVQVVVPTHELHFPWKLHPPIPHPLVLQDTPLFNLILYLCWSTSLSKRNSKKNKLFKL